jgi:hypothetical protein
MGAIETKCPECGSFQVRVVLTKSSPDGIIRRRHCRACDHRWYTHQPYEQVLPPYALAWTHTKPLLVQQIDSPFR